MITCREARKNMGFEVWRECFQSDVVDKNSCKNIEIFLFMISAPMELI